MKITYLDFDDINNPLLGAGQARATFEVASRLVKLGHQVSVISSKYPGYKDRIEAGIVYKHIGAGTKFLKFNNAIYILTVPFVVPALTSDIIIECFTAPISTLFSPLFTKIPVVALPSMFNAQEFSNKYHLPFYLIERLGIRFYKYALPYSETDSAKIKKLNPYIKFKIVGQGVGEEFFRIPHRQSKHILFFGRLDIWQKGIDLLLEAYAKVADKINYPLVIAGHGPDENKVKALITKLGLEDKVKLIGPVYGEQKAKVFSESLFVAFPSRHDEMCLATLEVLAAGLPLACFDLPESKWISPKVALKSPMYDTTHYAQALLNACGSTVIAPLRQNARSFAKQFNWDTVATQFDLFLKQVLRYETKKQ